MKFNCGLTPETEQKNEWDAREKRVKDALADQKIWRKHFCLWPVQIGDNDCRWFEWVERRPQYSFKYWWHSLDKYDVRGIDKWIYRSIK